MKAASGLIQKVWSYAHVLKDDGLAFLDYTEQITYLLFLKMAWEQRATSIEYGIPPNCTWEYLSGNINTSTLTKRYQKILKTLSEQPGLLGLIFTKPQSKINDPAKLRRLIEMIDSENWSSLDVDVKGEIYEGLLSKNAEDVRGGAGQYFTPRPVIRAIVEAMQPASTMKIADPACGTGGFLLAAFDWLKDRTKDSKEERFLRNRALHGSELVSSVARLCAMNLYLHGIGADPARPVVSIGDSLSKKSPAVDMVLTNPPFGKKSSITIISDGRKAERDEISYDRSEFWATTSNKQLNFVQHVYSMLKPGGRAAMVIPDNVLFEAGAGEKIRRALLQFGDVHTLLRLPTGIWYSTGVNANVLFFDKSPSIEKNIWVYDLRTNKNFTQRRNPIDSTHLSDFVKCYKPLNRKHRVEGECFRRYSYEDILKRDKANWDIFWLKNESQENTENLPRPDILASEIMALLEEAIVEFRAVEKTLKRDSSQ